MEATIDLISRQELRLEELSIAFDEAQIAAEENGNIDPEERAILDRIDAKILQAKDRLLELKAELENSKSDWEAQSRRVEVLQGQLQEMERWGHPEIDTLRGEFVKMTDAEFSKKWKQAIILLGQAETSFEPAYEFYKVQSTAQPRYEQRRSLFNQRMDQLRRGAYQTEKITRLIQQLETDIVGIDAAAKQKDYVKALSGIEDALEDVKASEKAAENVDEQEAQYVSLRNKIQIEYARAQKINQHEAKEALKLVESNIQEMEAAAARDEFNKAMEFVPGIQSTLQNIFIREDILIGEKIKAETNIHNLENLVVTASAKRYEDQKKVIEAFTSSFENYKRLYSETKYELLEKAWSDLEPKADTLWDAIRIENLERKVLHELKEMEATLASASTSEFSLLTELQQEIGVVVKSLRKAIDEKKWFDAEDFIKLLKPLLREYEARRKEQQALKQQYQEYLSELRGQISEAFPGHEDADNKLLDLKSKISDVDDRAVEYAKATNFEKAVIELSKIDALLFEVYAINSGKVRGSDITTATNEAIKVVVNESMNAFTSELNTVAGNFKSFTDKRVEDSDDGNFGSDIVGFAANVVGVIATKHPVWAVIGFSVSFATDIVSDKIDASKDAKNQARQIVKNIRKLSSETAKLFDPEFGEKLMSKQPQLWDALAEHVALNEKDLVAQARIRTHLYSIGLPEPRSGFGKELYRKMIGRFLVWEHDQKLVHRLNDHKGHVGEEEISNAIDREIASVYAEDDEDE